MTAGTPTKQKLTVATRRRSELDEDDEAQRARPRRQTPGKGVDHAQLDPAGAAGADLAPGKLSLEDAGRNTMEPAAAIRYADWIATGPRVDRRAEVPEVDDGALASAFEFIADARGAGLPTELRARLERELRIDLGSVRLHTDAAADHAARALGARAFTIGDDVYFAAGAYDPASESGIELIAHEIAHVAQQRRSGKPGPGARRVSRSGDASETSADEFATRFRRAARQPLDPSDPASLVEQVRRDARRLNVPGLGEIENELGASLGHVEAYVGDAATLACRTMAAGAFAVRGVVAFADPSPRRDKLIHELTHIVQMGNRSAPSLFAPGTLKISHHSDPAEVEARAGAGRPAVHADPDTIHRDGDTGSTDPENAPDGGDNGTPVTRFAEFTTSWINNNKNTEKVFGYPATMMAVEVVDPTTGAKSIQQQPVYDPQYTVSTKNWFFLNDYTTSSSSWTNFKGKAKRHDLEYLYSGANKGPAIGLTKGRDKSSQTWAWIATSATEVWHDYVVKLEEEARSRPDPNKQWAEYTKWCDKLGFDFEIVAKRTMHKDAAAGQDGHIYELGEASLFRSKLFEEIAKKYSTTTGEWGAFYTDIVTKEPFKLNTGLVGNAFEAVVAASLAAGKTKYDSKRYKFDIEGDNDGEKYTRTSDGSVVEFKAETGDMLAIVADCKAYQLDLGANGKPLARKSLSGDIRQQAMDYAKAVGADGGDGLKGYRKDAGTVVKKQFNHCVYIFPTGDVSRQWYPDLSDIFGGAGNKYLSIVPKFDSITFLYDVNPTFSIDLPQKGTHHTIANPPIFHPGAHTKQVNVTLQREGSPELASGSVTLDMDMGGAFKGDSIVKPLRPAAAGGANPSLENKFPSLKPKGLDQILKRFDVDAKLNDSGVEASVDIKAGPSGIPNFNLTASKITAAYTDGGLNVTGEVGIAHTSGKISGKIKASWNGSDWNFEGTATVAVGLVDGLKPFDLKVKYENGQWSVGCDNVEFEKKFSAVTLTGKAYGVWYDIKKGTFSGSAELRADMGMFGTATAQAEIKDNKLAKASLAYDSPELKYPAKSDKPALAGTVGGTLTYENEQFSGAIRGTAKINVPALQKIAGDSGLGLRVDAHVNADGSYGGTIGTTTPLKFGKYFEIPSVSATINDDGSVTGDFSIAIKNIKHLENAAIGCRIDKTGFHVTSANIHASFGAPTDKMWGSLDVGYAEATGLAITGTLNVKIKEGMVATGSLTYNSQTNDIDVSLTVQEITLFDFSKTQSLFKFSKQIPLVSFYSIIGIYLDLGLDLDFDFSMKLGLKPTITLEGLSFETWEYKKIAAAIELTGQLRAALTATPKLGLGLFAISPSLLRGGGGLKMPITAEALLTPKAMLQVGYSPSGGVEGDATIGMQLTFGIKGAVQPYAEAAVLDGMWNPNWTGDALTEFEILPPKELFNFTLDLAGDMKPKQPQIPTSPQAPTAPTAARQLPQDTPKTNQVGDNGPGRDATPPTTAPAGGGGADDSMFKMSTLMGALKGLPGYQTISGFMDKAAKVWDQIKGFFGRIVKAFKNFFAGIEAQLEEVLNGFATEGLGYLPKLIQKIVGPDVWDVIEPIINAAAGSAEQILQLFETSPPANAADFFPWALKLMQKAFGIGFDSIPALINAFRVMMGRLAGMAKKIVNEMVHRGMVGVKRHQYYYWAFGDHYFLAADEYKINMLGINIHFRESGMLLNPNDLVGAGLFDVLEQMGVPPTNTARDDKTGDTYRDRWA
ncbi:MAG TPA: DUF4157 domain-containing protein [Kofleriaceae bacterium]|nr:DUF4157 domain-containing protein [Kofleriaceae bacterium]